MEQGGWGIFGGSGREGNWFIGLQFILAAYRIQSDAGLQDSTISVLPAYHITLLITSCLHHQQISIIHDSKSAIVHT